MDDELEPTEEELAEAAALALALDRGMSAEAPPDDVLQTAALLQFSHDGAELEPQRAQAILADVFAEARVRRPEAAAPWWRWFVPVSLTGVAAAAAVLIAIAPAVPEALELPAPQASLLQAQAAAATGNAAELDHEMESYRGNVLDALESRYGVASR